MPHRRFARLLTLMTLGLVPMPVFAASATGHDAVPEKPNVLFIIVDDLKPVLGCYGNTQVKSPHIDRLAARGTTFDRAYCNQAVCAPSRNSMMTGLRPQTLGIYDLGTNFRRALPDAVTLPQYFQKAGYRTEAYGKVFHVGQGNHEDAASWTVPHWSPPPSSYYLLPQNAARYRHSLEIGSPHKGPATEEADVPDNAYGDGMIADVAIRRLEYAKAHPDHPFFIAVGFNKPHLAFNAPRKYWDLYHDSDFTVPALRHAPLDAPSWAPTTWGELRTYTDIVKSGPVPDAQARHLIHGYYAATSFADAQVGRVIDRLDALGLARNTIIVLWGDNGWHLGDHGMWAKHTNYEQAARVPLILAGPGVESGVHTRSFIENVDLYPTLAELAGLSAPVGLDGRSFVPVLRDPSVELRDHVIHVFPRKKYIGRAIRTARYRLVEWKVPGAPGETAVYELYDYEADPDETRNLATQQPEVVSRLRALLASYPEAKPQIH